MEIVDSEKWWQDQELWLQHRVQDMCWVREAIPSLGNLTYRFSAGYAFILGTGPSIREVKDPEWAALSSYFTVGINQFSRWFQEERRSTNIPALNFFVDERRDTEDDPNGSDKINEAFKRSMGKTLCGYSAWRYHHDWLVPVHGGDPQWDIEFGLFFTPMFRMNFNRCAIAAIHLCALLGYSNICLLGIDHGQSYKDGADVEIANRGYSLMNAWLGQRNVQLIQCGGHSAVNTLRYIPLRRALKDAAKYANDETARNITV